MDDLTEKSAIFMDFAKKNRLSAAKRGIFGVKITIF